MASENHDQLLRFLLEKKFILKDFELGISYRVINHWNTMNLFLDEKENERSWRRLSPLDYVWLKLVQELRAFGLPLEAIVNVKQGVLSTITRGEFYDNLVDMMAEDFDQADISGGRHQMSMSLEEYDRFFAIAEKGNPDDVMYDSSQLILALFSIIVDRHHMRLIVNSEGECEIWNQSIPPHEDAEWLMRGSHLNISLNTIVASFLELEQKTPELKQLQLLTEQERELLELIRTDNIKSLTINYLRGGEIKSVELTEVLHNVSLQQRYADHLFRSGYQDISYKTQEGRLYHFERTTKINMR